MIQKTLLLSALLALGFVTSDSLKAEDAPCIAPVNTPLIPDGNVASKDELLAAQNSIKSFQESNLDYLTCLDKKREALPEDTPENAEALAKIKAAEEAAIALEESVANEFNSARAIYLER